MTRLTILAMGEAQHFTVKMAARKAVRTIYLTTLCFLDANAETIPDDTYSNKLVHSSRLTLLATEPAVNFLHCTTLCRLSNYTEICSGITFDRATKDCVMKWIDFAKMPLGGKEELFVRRQFTSEFKSKSCLIRRHNC